MAPSILATFKLSPEQWETFKARANTRDTNASQVLKRLVAEYLEGHLDDYLDTGIDTSNRIDQNLDESIDARIDEKLKCIDTHLDQRIDERLKYLDAKTNRIDDRREYRPAKKATGGIAATGNEKRADGETWLTSKQAYSVAIEQGCDRTFNGWRSWVKRNPEECQKLYGLRSTGYSGKSNIAPSFERV